MRKCTERILKVTFLNFGFYLDFMNYIWLKACEHETETVSCIIAWGPLTSGPKFSKKSTTDSLLPPNRETTLSLF